MQLNLELGVVVSLLPLVDSLDHKQVHYKLFFVLCRNFCTKILLFTINYFLFCVEIFVQILLFMYSNFVLSLL